MKDNNEIRSHFKIQQRGTICYLNCFRILGACGEIFVLARREREAYWVTTKSGPLSRFNFLLNAKEKTPALGKFTILPFCPLAESFQRNMTE